jgi:hypothetical protein
MRSPRTKEPESKRCASGSRPGHEPALGAPGWVLGIRPSGRGAGQTKRSRSQLGSRRQERERERKHAGTIASELGWQGAARDVRCTHRAGGALRCLGGGGDSPSARFYMNHIGSNQWQGALRTVGYYSDRSADCDVDLNSTNTNRDSWADTVNSKCGSYYGGDEGSINADGSINMDQDVRNLSCRLAWHIYVNYAANFKNVRVVASSMGGLLIRYALDCVQHQPKNDCNDPTGPTGPDGQSWWPPVLYVTVVIAMGTPHGGIADPAGA